jgi:hypothetical protein
MTLFGVNRIKHLLYLILMGILKLAIKAFEMQYVTEHEEYDENDEIDEMVRVNRYFFFYQIIRNDVHCIDAKSNFIYPLIKKYVQESGEAAHVVPLEMYAPAHRSRSWIECFVKVVPGTGQFR